MIPGLALHTDVGPDDPMGAVVGFVLAVMASSGGFAVPEGGAGAITGALLRRVEEHGGAVRCGARVSEILVRGGRAAAVRTEAGEEIEATRAVVADVGAPALYLKLLNEAVVPPRIVRAMRRFVRGFGTFKMDWALDGPVPWAHEDAARAAVVHAGDSLDDLARFTREVRAGALPEHPYLVIGQQSLADPTRAPGGRPHALGLLARAERRRRRLGPRAPGASPTASRRASRASPPASGSASWRARSGRRTTWRRSNENLVGGDLAGGSAAIRHQLVFRPVFPWFRYRTPIAGALPGLVVHPPGRRRARGVRRQRGEGRAGGRVSERRAADSQGGLGASVRADWQAASSSASSPSRR